jgi:hypothetical protein
MSLSSCASLFVVFVVVYVVDDILRNPLLSSTASSAGMIFGTMLALSSALRAISSPD